MALPLSWQGYIGPVELYIFFKEIHDMWVNVLHEYADLSIYDVVDEILDMVKPKVGSHIAWSGCIKCLRCTVWMPWCTSVRGCAETWWTGFWTWSSHKSDPVV